MASHSAHSIFSRMSSGWKVGVRFSTQMADRVMPVRPTPAPPRKGSCVTFTPICSAWELQRTGWVLWRNLCVLQPVSEKRQVEHTTPVVTTSTGRGRPRAHNTCKGYLRHPLLHRLPHNVCNAPSIQCTTCVSFDGVGTLDRRCPAQSPPSQSTFGKRWSRANVRCMWCVCGLPAPAIGSFC